MKARLWIRLFCCCLLLSAVASVSWGEAPSSDTSLVFPEANLLIISIETTRADHLSCYGYDKKTTPFVDWLATQGVLFERAFATRGWTWPSLTSMLTGLYPTAHGVRKNGQLLPKHVPTLTDSLHRHGFSTAAFVANYCRARMPGVDKRVCEVQGGDRRLTKKAIRWIQNHHKERFFAWIHYDAPHRPYRPPQRHDVFTDPKYQGLYEGSEKSLNPVTVKQELMAKEDLEHVIGLYDGSIRFIDSQIREIFNTLRSKRLLAKTLIVVLADHGEDLYQHNGYFFHQCSIYDSSLHVPLIIRFPKNHIAGHRVEEVVGIIDLPPTLLEALGLPELKSIHGRSLLGLMTGKQGSEGFTEALSEHDRDIRTIRTAKWRYVYNPSGKPMQCKPVGDYYRVAVEELYDLEADPLEQLNVISEHPEVAKSLKKKLLEAYPKERGKGAPFLPEEELDKIRSLGYLL